MTPEEYPGKERDSTEQSQTLPMPMCQQLGEVPARGLLTLLGAIFLT